VTAYNYGPMMVPEYCDACNNLLHPRLWGLSRRPVDIFQRIVIGLRSISVEVKR
jgi:hypothetical protein